jgi:hypothetical protein
MVDESPGRHRRRAHPVRRTITWTLVAVLVAVVAYVGVTFTRTYQNSDGEPTSVIVATWMRDNHMAPLVAQLENLYYRYIDTPEVGGTPTLSADISTEDQAGADDSDVAAPTASATPRVDSVPLLLSPHPSAVSSLGSVSPPASAPALPPTRPHLDPPPTIVSPVKNPEPKEGQWQPVASRVDGVPAVYVARVRADDVHTSYYASAMWIDTTLTKAMLVPGYEEPGGPNPYNGALPEELWPDVLANVNGAFRLDDSQGGYYYKGKTVRPLVDGKASAVITKDGTIRIGKWGRDLSMSPDVDVVRQNLDLIVDKGTSKVSNGADHVVWGATTDKESLAWRAALGQRADGSIVYVGSPYLSAEGLANVLVGAGVERAMVLDMNEWWTAGFYFRHAKDGTPLCRKLDPAIAESCDRFLRPYKRDSFQFLANRG